MLHMGVKIGLAVWRTNRGWRYSRIGRRGK